MTARGRLDNVEDKMRVGAILRQPTADLKDLGSTDFIYLDCIAHWEGAVKKVCDVMQAK